MSKELDLILLGMTEEFETRGALDVAAWVRMHPEHRDEIIEYRADLEWAASEAEIEAESGPWPDVGAASESLARHCQAISLGESWLSTTVGVSDEGEAIPARDRELGRALARLRGVPRPKGRRPSVPFQKAVLIAWGVGELTRRKRRVTRFTMNKLTYFLEHGLALEVFDNHTQQRYGPYDHKARYGGPEQILVKNGYVKVHGTSFLPGDKIDAAYQYALKYLPDRGVAESLIDRLASLTDNELETWSTVLWAARDLVSRSEEVGAARVLGYIGDSAKWKPKLGEPHFELSRVEDALRSLRDLGLLPA